MLSKTFAYAIKGLTYIALHGSKENRISILQLSEGINVSASFLGKIMQELARKKIVHSAKGPGGGFWLDEKSMRKSAFDILKIVDPGMISNTCLMGKTSCSHDFPCPLHHEYLASRTSLFKALSATTLFNLAGKVEAGDIFLKEKS